MKPLYYSVLVWCHKFSCKGGGRIGRPRNRINTEDNMETISNTEKPVKALMCLDIPWFSVNAVSYDYCEKQNEYK